MVAILLETVNETSRKRNDLHRRELKTHSSLFSAPSSSFSFSFSTFISFFLSLSLSLSLFLSLFSCFFFSLAVYSSVSAPFLPSEWPARMRLAKKNHYIWNSWSVLNWIHCSFFSSFSFLPPSLRLSPPTPHPLSSHGKHLKLLKK